LIVSVLVIYSLWHAVFLTDSDWAIHIKTVLVGIVMMIILASPHCFFVAGHNKGLQRIVLLVRDLVWMLLRMSTNSLGVGAYTYWPVWRSTQSLTVGLIQIRMLMIVILHIFAVIIHA